MSKFLKMIFNILLIIIIVLLVVYFALRITDKVKIYCVETGSMEDKIHTGDYILLYRKDKYYIGDVVTYRIDNYFVTHRIIKIEGNMITTKGDANNKEDEPIIVNQIEGKVIYCGGLLNIVIKYKYVIAAFLICLYLISCYFKEESEIIELKKNNNLENEVEKNNEKTREIKKENKDKNDKKVIEKKKVEKTKQTKKK